MTDQSRARLGWALAALIGLLTAWAYLYSRLAFSPVPWPDASAFYLPGVDLVAWPPRWRMHAQAMFVPSYDQANFNTMPLLPLLLGLGAKLGLARLFGATIMTRVVSLIPLFAGAALLWRWARQAKLSRAAAAILGLAFLWDPVLRWGTLVVRTETWIGLAWIYILKQCWELSRSPERERRSLFKIAAALAAAAYFHFEAVILVPPTAIALATFAPPRAWLRRLAKVAALTLVFLSPWIAYLLLHLGPFVVQMNTQFHRLAHGNQLVSTGYALFHSLFISHGSPVSWPKFFNLAKAIFWALIFSLAALTALVWLRRGSERERPAVLLTAALVAFAASLALWITKPEIWFTTLCHLTLWPWLAVALFEKPGRRRWAVALAAGYAVLSLGASFVQDRRTPREFSWANYDKWIDCIDQETQGLTRIWQPHVPDALVELSYRHYPRIDLTRAFDFPGAEDLAWRATPLLDAILFTRSLADPRVKLEPYDGPERPEDRELLKDPFEAPFGQWALERFPREQPGRWRMRVCEVGPFWADIALRNR